MKLWLWQLLVMCKGENWSFVGIDRLAPVEVAEKEDGVGLTEEIIVFVKWRRCSRGGFKIFLAREKERERENRAGCFLGVNGRGRRREFIGDFEEV